MKFAAQGIQQLQPNKTQTCFCSGDLDLTTLTHKTDLDVVTMYCTTKMKFLGQLESEQDWQNTPTDTMNVFVGGIQTAIPVIN